MPLGPGKGPTGPPDAFRIPPMPLTSPAVPAGRMPAPRTASLEHASRPTTGRPNLEGNTAMSNITLKAAVRVNVWANTAVSRIQKRYAAMDRGQTAFEYLGIILVVVAIIGAIVATGIGGAISRRIRVLVTSITTQ